MKRNFLLMLLLTLLPMVGWAQGTYSYTQTVEWKSGLSTQEFSEGVTPDFPSLVTVRSTATYSGYGTPSHEFDCEPQAVGTGYPTGSNALYNYNVYADELSTTPITTSPLPVGNYVLRLYVHYVNGANATWSGGMGGHWNWTATSYTNGTFMLPFEVIAKPEVTVTVYSITKTWDDPWAPNEPTMDLFNTTPELRKVEGGSATWNDVKDYLQYKRVDNGTDVGSYSYTLALKSVHPTYVLHISDASAKLNITQATNTVADATKLKINGWTYGDEPNAPVNDGVFKYGNDENVVYTYAVKGTTDFTDKVPTAAGEYTLKATAPETINYTEISSTTDFTIAQYELVAGKDFDAPTAKTGVVYNEGKQDIATAGVFKGTFKDEIETAGAEFRYPTAAALPQETDVNTYSFDWDIYVPTTSNFKYTAGAKPVTGATIVEATITDADVTAPVGDATLKYILDTPQQLIKTGAVVAKDGKTLAPKGTPKYSVDGGAWTDDLTKIVGEHVKAGDAKYVVSWYIEGDANHNDFGSTTNPAGTVEVAIAPVQFNLTADAEVATGLVFDNTAQKLLSKSVTGGAANMPVGSTTWSLDGTALAAGSTYEDVKATHAGEYTISYTVVPKDAKYENDYLPYTKELTTTIGQYTLYIGGNEIKKKTIEDVVDLATGTPKISMADFIKDGALIGGEDDATKAAILNSLIAPTQTLEEIITNAKVGVNAVGLQAVDVTPAKKAETNYKVDAAHLLSNSASLEIVAKEAAIQTPPAGYAADALTYNGDPQELIETAAVGYKANGGAGTVAIGKVVYSLTGNDGDWSDNAATIKGTNQGTYNVYYKVELDKSDAATNLDRFYKYSEDVKVFKVVINKKELKDEMFVLTPSTNVYTGEDLTPALSTKDGEPIDAENDFTVAKTNAEGPVTEMVDVDTYTYTFTATDGGNYFGTATATFTITKADASVATAPAALTLTYNGAPQALVSAAAGVVGGEVQYSLNGGTFSKDVPTATDADTYTVTWKLVGDKNHKDIAVSAAIENVKIAPKALEKEFFVFTNASLQTTFNYEYQYALLTNYTLKEGEPINSTDYDEIPSDDTMVNAGNYTLTFKGKNNYTGEIVFDLIINKKDQETKAPTAINLTYNGEDQELVNAGTTDLGCDVEYSLTGEDESWSTAIPTGFNAGDYTVYYRFVEDKNHNATEGGEVPVTILKANIGYMLSNIEKTWNGETFSAEEVEKLFTLYAGELKGNDVYDVPFTLNLPEDYKDAGTYTFKQPTVTFKEGYPENYKVNFSGEAQVVIDKEDIVAEDFTAPVAINRTFDGTEKALVEPGKVKTEYEGKAIGTIKYATTEDGPYTETIPTATAAKNNYSVWYKVEGDKNHNNFEPVEIAPIVIAPKAIEFALKFEDATETYTGKDFMPANLNAYDVDKALEEEVDFTRSIKKGDADVEEIKNVGTYVFTYTGKGNYEGSSAERTIEITKAELTEEMIPDYVAEKPYNGEDQIFDIALVSDGLTAADYEVTKSAEKFINAGEYTFTFTATEEGNYTGEISADFEITHLEVIAEAADATKVYDGEEGFDELPVITFSGVLPTEKAEDVFTFDAKAFTIVESAPAVGTYAFTVDPEKITATNYVVSAVNGANFIITPAPLMVNWDDEAEPFTKVYGDEDPELTASAANVIVTGAVNAEEVAAIIAGTVITRAEGEAVGDYAVTLAADEDAEVFANYIVDDNTFSGYDKGFVITPATIKVSIAALKKVYDGEPATIEVTAEDLVVTGLQNGDNKEDIFTTLPTATVADGEAVNVGTYQVTLADAEAADYDIKYIPATYEITKAKITATIDEQQIRKGLDVEENLDAAAFTIEGAAQKDLDEGFFYVDVNDEYQNMDGKLTADKGTYADGLVLVVDDEVADNYEKFQFFGVLDVLPAVATVLADDVDFTIDEDTDAEGVTFADRAINYGFWNVVALPFEASVAQISEAFGYAAVDVLNKDANDGNIHFQVISSGTVPAYTPFIVKTTADDDLVKKNFNEVVFENVTIKAWPTAKNSVIKDAAQNEFIGTFMANTEIPAKSQEYWYMSKGTWYDTMNRSKAVNLKAFRAYVHFNPANLAAGARIFIEEPDGTETAIDAVEFNNMVNGDTYTVDGMKVNKAQKGVYIQNGKKIAVK